MSVACVFVQLVPFSPVSDFFSCSHVRRINGGAMAYASIMLCFDLLRCAKKEVHKTDEKTP